MDTIRNIKMQITFFRISVYAKWMQFKYDVMCFFHARK